MCNESNVVGFFGCTINRPGASASTSASGANARSAGGRASASTSAEEAHARSAGERASASTSASGAIARSAVHEGSHLELGLRPLRHA